MKIVVMTGSPRPKGTTNRLADEKSRLYAAVDALNARYGKGKVFSAAQGLGARSWHMKRQKLSRRPTTRWDELMTVR